LRETKRKSLHISSSSLQGYHLSSRRYYTNTGTGRPQQHSIQINNLQTNTIYYFFVDSGQASGTGTGPSSHIMQFRTAA
jgi:hypothetical protein